MRLPPSSSSIVLRMTGNGEAGTLSWSLDSLRTQASGARSGLAKNCPACKQEPHEAGELEELACAPRSCAEAEVGWLARVDRSPGLSLQGSASPRQLSLLP